MRGFLSAAIQAGRTVQREEVVARHFQFIVPFLPVCPAWMVEVVRVWQRLESAVIKMARIENALDKLEWRYRQNS